MGAVGREAGLGSQRGSPSGRRPPSEKQSPGSCSPGGNNKRPSLTGKLFGTLGGESSDATWRDGLKPSRSLSAPACCEAAHSSRSLFEYLSEQIGWSGVSPTGTGLSGADLQRRREGIYNFFQVPMNLEPMLLLGYAVCFDSFAQQFTFLPLRLIGALWTVVRRRSPSAAQKRDLIRAVLLISVSALMLRINMSEAYHNVRNQSTMKLYVVFNVLEVFDKLFSSFGQDILESLYRMDKKRHRGVVFVDFVIALLYVTLHTIVLFYQSVALNVAVNSHNNVLLTLLISNNFTELKTAVFKRCETENLFQISCSDAVERFQLTIYLLLVAVQKGVQTSEWTPQRLQEFGEAMMFVVFVEIMIDWTKHAFVTKFNRIRPDVYSKFIMIISTDVVGHMQSCRHEPLTAVGSRMGFIPLPLLCIVVRVLGNDVFPLLDMRHSSGWLLCLLLWLTICALKVLVSVAILGWASVRVQWQQAADESSSGSATPETSKADGRSDARPLRLDGVDRYTLFGKQVM